ncbi:MAG: FAD binding domain-containing protein [Acidobacteriota bacterium]
MTEYCIPGSVTEALKILAAHRGRAMIIAGGTDAMPDIRRGKKKPHCLVDITRIPGLDAVAVEEEFVDVGAAVTFSALRHHPYLQSRFHALTEASAAVGAPDIQNVATWAGNLVQAMPAADGAIVALALDAQALVEDVEGARWQPVADLFAGPGRSKIDPTCQILTHLRFPIPDRVWGTAWRRIGRRDSLVLPILNCAVMLEVAEGRVAEARIAVGPVAPVPFRAVAAEAFLVGKLPGEAAFRKAARIVQAESDPRSSRTRASREYRLAVLTDLIHEALSSAALKADLEPDQTLFPNEESRP